MPIHSFFLYKKIESLNSLHSLSPGLKIMHAFHIVVVVALTCAFPQIQGDVKFPYI